MIWTPYTCRYAKISVLCVILLNAQCLWPSIPLSHYLNFLEFLYHTYLFCISTKEDILFSLILPCLPYEWSWCHLIFRGFSDGDFAIHMLSASSIRKDELDYLDKDYQEQDIFTFLIINKGYTRGKVLI